MMLKMPIFADDRCGRKFFNERGEGVADCHICEVISSRAVVQPCRAASIPLQSIAGEGHQFHLVRLNSFGNPPMAIAIGVWINSPGNGIARIHAPMMVYAAYKYNLRGECVLYFR